MTFSFTTSSTAFTPQPSPIAIPMGNQGVCRKRKDMEMDDEDSSDCSKERRRLPNVPASDEVAQFHPLPPEMNRNILSAMGYQVGEASQSCSLPSSFPSRSDVFGESNSPSSSSETLPTTPTDLQESESYFRQQYRKNYGDSNQSSPSSDGIYPNLDLYPHLGNIMPRPPGLMGMHLENPDDDMDLDDGQPQAGPSHGKHCKSIPQLSVRSEPGVSSELWARCNDCGFMSKVVTPQTTSLSFSP